MKKTNDEDDMRAEYDFSKGIRGKYIARLKGKRVVLLDEDVAEKFSDSDAVNHALRILMKAGAEAVESSVRQHVKAS